MIIKCFNIKQVIVRIMSLRCNRHYYIFDYDVRLWHTADRRKYYRYITDPRLMVFKSIGVGGAFIKIKAISGTSDTIIYNSFSESSGSYFRINLS